MKAFETSDYSDIKMNFAKSDAETATNLNSPELTIGAVTEGPSTSGTMGKKGRQSDPSINTDDSTESCDENQNTSVCTHINKGVDLARIKKLLIRRGFLKDCDDCNRDPIQNGLEMNSDYEYDLSLWLCLKCGNQACGRGKNKHALLHWKTPHSDCHALCVNTTVWSVWCYECDDEVNVTCRRKLLECIDYLKKHSESNNVKNQSVPSVMEDKIIEFNSIPPCIANSELQKLPRTCGLTNLGNTCFFNSVMQCLGQTPYLLELLDETSKPGQYFKLPGGKLTPEDKDSPILDPLDGELEEWKPLTRFLAETLRELQSGRAEVYTPRLLHSKLTQRLPQFGGGDQHDSHELLRHLLEAVREEDLRRYQAVILDKLGFSKKTDPSTVEGEKRKIIKFYGQQASDFLLPTEQVFRGILVSTLQCQVCEHTSYREEFFLDLSLPIVEKQVPPVLRRKADELDDNKPSKHQLKKEKKAARKAKKHKSHRNVINYNDQMNSPENQNIENSDSESDADIEDNTEDASSTTINDLAKGSTESSLRESINKGLESGYHSEKIDNGSPSNRLSSPLSMSIDESPQIGMRSVSPLNACSVENSPSSSETNIDMGSPILGRNSPAEMIEEQFLPVSGHESRMSFVNQNMEVDLAQLSLLNDGDRNNALNKSEGLDNRLDEACKQSDEDEKMEDDFDLDMWTGTMSPRYKCEEGECSVQSCLNQFTACELMTANNKVGCELCTKRNGGQKKTVYTDARKQLLIYNPPAVLILHLKRFQVSFFRPSKMSKHVSFPALLDLAPFCSKRSQNLPTFEAGQTKVLYSLYGVVEHSGSLHGGHYVAYVKVRSKLEDNSYRWNFLPKNQKEKNCDSWKGAQGEPQIPPGKWFYVSDSHVSEVQESKVLRAQAYLLFYERIM